MESFEEINKVGQSGWAFGDLIKKVDLLNEYVLAILGETDKVEEEIVKNLAELKTKAQQPKSPEIIHTAVPPEPEIAVCEGFLPNTFVVHDLPPAPEPVPIEAVFVEPEISNCIPIPAPEPVLLEPVLLVPVLVEPEISNCPPISAPEPVLIEPVLLEPVLVEPEISNCPPIYAPEIVLPEPVPEPEAKRESEIVSDFEIIDEDELNMSDTEKNESEVTVIENPVHGESQEGLDDLQDDSVAVVTEPIVMETENTKTETIKANRTFSSTEEPQVTETVPSVVTSESVSVSRTISTSEAIETKTVKTSQSEPQNEPKEAAVTSEDIFAEATRVGEAKKGIAIEDIFAQSAQIGFQNRK